MPMEFFLLTATLLVAAFAISRYLDYRRTQAVKAVAGQIGFTYQETSTNFVDHRISQSTLCSKGRNRRLKNVIKGHSQDIQVSVGDYNYTTGSGKNKSTHRQTIVILDCSQMYLPRFSLSPENIFHKIGNFLGYPDINFDSHPTFSKRYRLTGPDEYAIRSCFDSSILTFFETHSSFCVEGMGSVLLYYKRNYSCQPQEWQKLINTAFRVYKQFYVS